MFDSSLVHQSSSLVLQNLSLSSSAAAAATEPLPSYPFGPDSLMHAYQTSLLSRAQQELSARFMQDRLFSSAAAASHQNLGIPLHGLGPQMHQHQHLHQHMHQHFMPPVAPGSSVPLAGAAGAFGPTSASSLFFGIAGYPNGASSSSSLSGLPPSGLRHGSSSLVLPLFNGPLGINLNNGLPGAFQPKNEVNTSLNPATHHLLTTQDHHHLFRTHGKKSGHWNTAHVRIAWKIHLYQQQKLQHVGESQRNGTNSKNNQFKGDVTLTAQLESLYNRLGVPSFRRSLYSNSDHNPFSGSVSFAGLGSATQRTSAPLSSLDVGVFSSSSPTDWLRLAKSSPFLAPPISRLQPEIEKVKYLEKERKEEGNRTAYNQEQNESEKEQSSNFFTRDVQSDCNRKERTRSRSPLRTNRNSSSRDGSSPPPPPSSSSSHRTKFLDRCESRDSDDCTTTQARNHRLNKNDSRRNTSPPIDPAPFPLFPAIPLDSRFLSSDLIHDGLYSILNRPPPAPYVWNRLEREQLMHRFFAHQNRCPSERENDVFFSKGRLSHLDLMFDKLPPSSLINGSPGLSFSHNHITSNPPVQLPSKSASAASSSSITVDPPTHSVLPNGHHLPSLGRDESSPSLKSTYVFKGIKESNQSEFR